MTTCNMAYPGTTIRMINEELWFIRPGNCFLVIHGLFPSISVVRDDTCNRGTWVDVCCVVPYPAVSAELCAPKQCYMDLNCFMNWATVCCHFCSTKQSPTFPFIDKAWTSKDITFTAGFTAIHPFCIRTNNSKLCTSLV